MKKSYVFTLIFTFILCSCAEKNKVIESSLSNNRDSILYYHKIATKENISLNKKKKAVNTALNFTNEDDSLFSMVLYQKSFLHFLSKEYDSLLFIGKKLSIHSDEIKNSLYLGKQYHLNAYYFDEVVQSSDSAFFYYNLSKGYFNNLSDSSQVGRRLMSMALIQKNQNDFFGSKETLTEALQYLHPEKDQMYIASSYNTLGTNHRKLINYQDAIKYYEKAITITNSKKDKLIYQNNLATAYLDNKQYAHAVNLLKSIISDSLLIKNRKEYARVLDNLTYAQWLSGEKTICEDFLAPLAIRQQDNDKRGQIASYTHLGEFYKKEDPVKAASYFDSVIKLSKTLKIPRAEKDALRFLMQLQPKNITLRKRYVVLQDSIYTQELKVKTQFAKYKYDNKLKQESILRLEKEKAEKALEVNRQRNQKIKYLGGTIFMASILGLALFGFKQRTKRLKQENKTARLEATYETEEELSRRLHDDHGGKINHIISLVQNNVDKLVILDNLEELYNQSRDFSREINEVNTGPNYKNELMAMLGSRKPLNVKLFTAGLDELDWTMVPALTKTSLFKVLQELMINMGKHSEANIVAITLEKKNNLLKINYEDDGVGASKKELQLKNGLRNTEKRIQATNGTITFDSEKGNGFRAEIHIPC